MEENWKDIEGYEGYYQVSDLGRVRSLDRVVIAINGKRFPFKGKILKPHEDRNGYLRVELHKENKKYKKEYVHRLVALAFVKNPDPDRFKEINHKDEDKKNCASENIEWCDRSYNCRYGNWVEKHNEKISKPVAALKNGEIVKIFKGIRDAGRELECSSGSICRAIKKVQKCRGYNWSYI